MGGAVSSGRDNDDLIDNLLDGGYIKTVPVERVFRAVDRGMYFLPDAKAMAYRDQAWKEGLIHLSAPCIYTEVLESLKLEPGMSFLNLGSGTGYLSTLVGLLIGANGTNHGVELHETNVKYAMERLQVFLRECVALRYFDFAVPKFLVGNALSLGDAFLNRYDRIYVGAACEDEERVTQLAKFLKIGGFMIIPNGDNLIRVVRTGEAEVSRENLMQCSFATLIPPTGEAVTELTPPKNSVSTLKCACRLAIVRHVRESILSTHPELFMPRTQHKHTDKPKPGGRFRRVIFPLLLAQNDDENDEPQIILGDAIHPNHNGNDGPDHQDLAALQAAAPIGNVIGAVLRLENSSSNREQSSSGRNLEEKLNPVLKNDQDSTSTSTSTSTSNSTSNSTSSSTSSEDDDDDDDDDDDEEDSYPTGSSQVNFSASTSVRFRKRRLSVRTTSESQTVGEVGGSNDASKRRSQLTPPGNRDAAGEGPSESSHSNRDPRLLQFSKAMTNLGSTVSVSEPTGSPSEPTGSSSEPTGSPSEPTGSPSEPTVSSSEPTGSVPQVEKMDVEEPSVAPVTSLPAGQQMEILMVQALKNLPIPKSFQRFLNFDRSLDD